MAQKNRSVKAVAEITGITIRALHHYDEIGLLSPGRASNGYRTYTDDDLLRLQQILVYRELGLPLERVKALLDDPSFDVRKALADQRNQLLARAETTAKLLDAVDAALRKLQGEAVEPEALFDGFDPARYEAEAEARWGSTDAYQESKRRTAVYDEATWTSIHAAERRITARIAHAIEAGHAPDSDGGLALAEAYRLHIDRYFYPCNRTMYGHIAAMYETDARFTANLDRAGKGVAAFLAAAARANANR